MTRDRLERATLVWALLQSPNSNLDVPQEILEDAFKWACRVLGGSSSSREELLTSILQEAALSATLSSEALSEE